MCRERRSVLQAVILGVTAMLVQSASADGLAAYSGMGSVHVVDDGRVVVEHLSPAAQTHLLDIDGAADHFLISNGTTASLLKPGAATPSGTVIKVQLNGNASETIGLFEGELIVQEITTATWNVSVLNGNTRLFSYDLVQAPVAEGMSSECSISCSQGSCACSSTTHHCVCRCVRGAAECGTAQRLTVSSL